tara:strand:- start:1557 stop:2054 length:498 start_codon:yes stop_codon:yes gene_type:complete
MISTAVLLFVVAGVLSFFLSFTEAGLRMGFYSELESQNQQLYQEISQDLRDAETVLWVDAKTLVLSSKGIQTTYTYDSSSKTLTREETGGPSEVIAGDLSEFSFLAYDLNGNSIDLTSNLQAASENTKMVGLEGLATKSHPGVVDSTASVQSAVYMLRNKGNTSP